GAPQPAGRHAQRRGAADARPCTRVHGPPAPAPARRAVARPRAAARHRDLPDHPRAQRARGIDRSRRRAERAHRAAARAARVRARGRSRRARRAECRAAAARIRSPELPGLLMPVFGRKTKVTTGASTPVLIGLLAACVFLVVGSLVSDIFAQQTVAGLAQGAIFASLALALVLIYRATEVINFAQGEMAMATTYIASQLTLWGLSYWLAFFLTLVIAFVYGVVVQLLVIRPVQHKSVVAVVIVTVGLFILID